MGGDLRRCGRGLVVISWFVVTQPFLTYRRSSPTEFTTRSVRLINSCSVLNFFFDPQQTIVFRKTFTTNDRADLYLVGGRTHSKIGNRRVFRFAAAGRDDLVSRHSSVEPRAMHTAPYPQISIKSLSSHDMAGSSQRTLWQTVLPLSGDSH